MEERRRIGVGVSALVDGHFGSLGIGEPILVGVAVGEQGIADVGADHAVGRVELCVGRPIARRRVRAGPAGGGVRPAVARH